MSDIQKVKKTVMVDLTQCQYFDDNDCYEFVEELLGNISKVGPNSFIITFDTIVNGEKYTNTLKLVNQVLSIIRIGNVHSNQQFIRHNWTDSKFFYAGGSIDGVIFTHVLDAHLNENGGFLEVLYELCSGDVRLGLYEIKVLVR